MIVRSVCGFVVALLAAAATGLAMGPHEILLLVNTNSGPSREIANHFCHLRAVPPENVVLLGLPDSVRSAEAEISREDFTRLIWEPARNIMAQRGLADQILAWVYSADFPVRVRTSPPMSLTGLTFTRNAVPEPGVIATGLYVSALFRGPARPGGPISAPMTLENLAVLLGTNLPLPAGMLAWTGARGNEPAIAIRALHQGRMADGTRPAGSVYFVTNADVRSTSRAWQFPAAAEELRAQGVAAHILPALPRRARDVAGLMMGEAVPDPSIVGAFLPGAMAEHLTSWAAVFHNPGQTKLTAWIEAGASYAAGTVVEPYSIWTKFPSGRFFAHQAAGCSTLESFYQSVVSPLQTLPVGDPFARPWGARASLVLFRFDNGGDTNRAVFVTQVEPKSMAEGAAFFFFLDGRRIAAGPAAQVEIDTSGLPDGWHEVRVALFTDGRVRGGAVARSGFDLARRGRSVEVVGPAPRSNQDALRPLTIRLKTAGAPVRVALFHLGCPVAEAEGTPEAALRVDPELLGAGPIEVQPLAVYADGELVRGKPLALNLAPRNMPATLRVSRVGPGAPGWNAAGADADGDRVRIDWFAPAGTADGAEIAGGEVKAVKGDWTLATATTNRYTVCAWKETGSPEFTAEVCLEPDHTGPVSRGAALLAFDFEGQDRFRFFGLDGSLSAWVFGDCANSNLAVRASRGAPLRQGRWHRLSVRTSGDGQVEGWVDGEAVLRFPREGAALGRTGLVSGPGTACFRAALSACGTGTNAPAGARPLTARAWDGFAWTFREAE